MEFAGWLGRQPNIWLAAIKRKQKDRRFLSSFDFDAIERTDKFAIHRCGFYAQNAKLNPPQLLDPSPQPLW